MMTASSANGSSIRGLLTMRNETTSSGFTAVNGEAQKSVPFSLDKSAHENGQQTSQPAESDSQPQYHTHGWRADNRASDPPQPGGLEALNKRKRSDSTEVQIITNGELRETTEDGDRSSKRQMTNADSAVDLTSPDTATQPTAVFQRGRSAKSGQQVRVSSREPSPVARWNHSAPVPPPRAETTAAIQASLQAVQAQQKAEAEAKAQARAPSQSEVQGDGEEAMSPNMDALNDADSPDGQNGDYDPKKRKRNFSNRTKTGCHTCRSRKKKCDETKPQCQNCLRGGFVCQGYGPKPPGQKIPPTTTRPMPIALQSKPIYEPSHGPSTYFVDDGPRYDHWGRVAQPVSVPEPPPHASPIDTRQTPPQHPHYRSDSWSRQPMWPPSDQPPQPYFPERLPPADFGPMPPLHTYPTPHVPPAPPADLWTPDKHAMSLYRHLSEHGLTAPSAHSSSTTSSQRTAALALTNGRLAHLSEKDKMILGQAFKPYVDDVLLEDRQQCKAALERYNDSARTMSGIGGEQRGLFFRAVVDPPTRPRYDRNGREIEYTGPKGFVGVNTIVESPFHCDYGYNLHLGQGVLIQPGCYMQDSCEIRIGDRTIVGPNVKFYGTTASVDKTKRHGSKGPFMGGAIQVGDDVLIGGDVVILPFRRIGNGAVIGAGSVVTRDVKENTVVAGNPAKVIRRIAGPDADRHHNEDIQEQNEKMMRDIHESALRDRDR